MAARGKATTRRKSGTGSLSQNQSLALEARYYIDEEIFKQEKRLIFYDSWQMICHVNDLLDVGNYVTGLVADQNVVVIRGRDGVLRGFHNVCAHRGHELLKGRGNVRNIICPYHAWAYSLDGALLAARHSTEASGFDSSCVKLASIKTEMFCDLIFVNCNPDAPSLRSQTLGMEDKVRRFIPKIDDLKHAHQITYHVKANWKLLIDNYLECYHCVVAHPKFKETFKIDEWKHTSYEVHAIQGKIDPRSPADPKNPNYTYQSAWWVWPNLFIPRFPDTNSLMVCRNIPASVEQTTQIWDFYFAADKPTRAQKEGIEWIDKVAGKEDLDLCESVQRGLHSIGYSPGKLMIDPEHFAGWSEHGVWYFQQMVRAKLKGSEKRQNPS
jgi:carnitine monooxygenase subunit